MGVLTFSPKSWGSWSLEKRSAAIEAAFKEFDSADVYAKADGLQVFCSVPDSDALLAANDRLHVACTYATCDL